MKSAMLIVHVPKRNCLSSYTKETRECLKAEIEGDRSTEEGREFHKVVVLGKKEYKKLEVRAKGLQRVKAF